MSFDLEFLRELSETPGVSAYERHVQKAVGRRVAEYGAIEYDALGNLAVTVNEHGSPHVLVTAHVDQIGLVVTHVLDDGFLQFEKVGILDPVLLPGHRVTVHAVGGQVTGVVCRPPTHLLTEAQRGTAPDIRQQRIDIGAKSREEALGRVAIGDPATFWSEFISMGDDLVAGPALDNRAGVYAAVRALELYAAAPGPARFTVATTVREETTFLGAKALAGRPLPDFLVVIDGDFACDYPGVEPDQVRGRFTLGSGPVINRGAGGSEAMFDLARQTAESCQMEYQVKADPYNTNTDADESLALPRLGALSLGYAIRYAHSPYEVVSAADLESLAHLVSQLVGRIGEEPQAAAGTDFFAQ